MKTELTLLARKMQIGSTKHACLRKPGIDRLTRACYDVSTMANQSLLFRLLLFYGIRFPYHRGKGWLHGRLLKLFNIHVDEEFDVVREGLHWRLNPADFVQADVFWLGRKDFYDVFHLRYLLQPGHVFLDIGANFGYYSVVLGSGRRNQCTLHAFEPNPATLRRLRYHVEVNGLNGTVRIHDVALADRVGEAALDTSAANSGRANVVAPDTAATPVKLTTLDTFCDEKQLTRLDLVKIDVEGFEERLLLGSRQALRRWQPVLLIEIDPPRLREKGSSAERVMALLREQGYHFFVSQRRSLQPLLNPPEDENAHLNVFCFPTGDERPTEHLR